MPSELNSAISKKEKKEKKAKGKLPKVESFQSVIDIFDGGLAPSPANKDLASIAESSSEAAKAFLAQHEITIHDPSAPPPCMSFDSAPFPAQLIKILNAQPFTTPSPVQAATWPLAVTGRDCLSIAKTGSGKTLGFMLPAIARSLASTGNRTVGPTVLIMAPTRELALQIKDEADKFGRPVGIQSVAVYGGAPKWKQTQELQRGADIVVATPGRMMDMLDLHGTAGGWPSTSLERCSVVVLDEADRMLDMGFEKDIRAIFAVLPAQHQTLFFTATWPKEVQRVAADLLSDTKVMVTVGNGGQKLTANKSVTQLVQVLENRDKWAAFEALTASYAPGGADDGKRVIIFANTKRDVNMIGDVLWERLGACVDTISGDRGQRERERTIAAFRDGSVTVVVATDVAARGLDVKGIERVINYDFPEIGRAHV